VLAGRDYVAPDDVRTLAGPVLAHRLVLAPGAAHRAEELVADLVARVPVPVVT
jgi:MoxR-like ATPase